MKTIITALFMSLLAISLSAKAPADKKQPAAQGITTTTLKVWGNCSMCKARIEKAATTAGATKADWEVPKQQLTVTFDSKKTSLDKIAKQIASAGHDNAKYKTTAGAYNALPGCCQYKRK